MAINYEQFSEVDLRTAQVKSAERVQGSDKLIRLILEAGDTEESGKPRERQIVAGIGKAYEPEELIGKTIVIVANLEPRELLGLTSEGMLLAATDNENRPVILTPAKLVAPGVKIK